jgi:hypothetical protein
MTTDVETIIDETIEKLNEWLQDAPTKHGEPVYRPFVLEDPHYRYDSHSKVETPEGKLFAHLMTYWSYICWKAQEGEEADEHGLAGDWIFEIELTLTPTGPYGSMQHPEEGNPMLEVVRSADAELTGFDDNFRGPPQVQDKSYRPNYYWRWAVRCADFREDMRVQLAKVIEQ